MTGIVHPGLFGVNLLYDQKDEHGQDLIEDGAVTDLVRVYKEYGFRYLRWPGGSVTENDACEDPKKFFNPDNRIGLNELVHVCQTFGFGAHIVLPTRVWKENTTGLARWLQELTAVPPGVIATIEIGNEYWGKDKNTGETLTPVEYGQVARKLLPKLRNALPGVPVFIQNAPHWVKHDSTPIYSQLAKASTPVLTGAVDHWYPQAWAGISNPGRMFEAMRERPEHFPTDVPWELNVSEWNVSLDNNKDQMLGLEQGLALANMLWRIAREEVEWASFWGFHYRTLANKLRGYRYNGVTYDTAAGTVFRTFQNLIGYKPVLSEIRAEKSVTFLDKDERVIYFKGQASFSDYDILESYQFIPLDDTRTPNLDETKPGADQHAARVAASRYTNGGYYMVRYRPKAARSPGGGLLGWLGRLLG